MKDDSEDLVSVIIPTYNRARFCKAAVESVLSQTYENVEVIIVDDGSTDNTEKIISGLNRRLKYIRQSNAGVSTARNTGLQAATGEYIAFLDSDDVWLPWKLEAQLKVLHAFPKAGMVWSDMKAINEYGCLIYESYLELMYSSYKYFDRERDFKIKRTLGSIWAECPLDSRERNCYAGNIFSLMFMGNLVHTSTVLLRRSCQAKVGFFDLSLKNSGEDYDFHFRTSRVGDVAYMDISTILYRVGAPDQLTQTEYMIWIARNNLKTIRKMLFNAKDEINLPASMMRRRLAKSHAWVGITEFDEYRPSARRHLLKSLSLLPFQREIAAYLMLSLLPNKLIVKLREFKAKIHRKGSEISTNNAQR